MGNGPNHSTPPTGERTRAARRLTPPRRRILVVDDDPIVLELARERLESLGHEVHLREDSIGTTQWVAVNRPDFILLDLSMPAIGGTELAQLLRRRDATADAKLILFSARSQAELVELLQSTGAVGAISKQETEEQFLIAVERMMRDADAAPRKP